jgi:SAM-dependent methyltransferase
LPEHAEILDFGCGDGLSFSVLSKFGRVRGIEPNQGLIRTDKPERQAIYSEPLGSSTYSRWKFDLITAFDVLEHIEDDRKAFDALLAMLAPNGFLVLTVPAFMCLWDQHDEVNQHFRRYTAKTLNELVCGTGRCIELRYMFAATFLPKFLISRWNGKQSATINQAAVPPPLVNRLLKFAFDWEERLLRPLRPPFGTSLLAVVQRDHAAVRDHALAQYEHAR